MHLLHDELKRDEVGSLCERVGSGLSSCYGVVVLFYGRTHCQHH